MAKKMSFVFPDEFYENLLTMKKKYSVDMTYIVMEAVNSWILERERMGEICG